MNTGTTNTGVSQSQQTQALEAAKRAVRRYAEDPSESNEERVSHAWRRLRELSVAARRRQAWLRPEGPDARGH